MTSTRNQRLVKRERPLFVLALTLLVVLLLSACQKEVVEPAKRIRAVKTILVADRASGQMRKFPGTVEPVDTSSISFEVTGLIQKVHIKVGDKFKQGETLAVLDKNRFKLNVESARAALSRARAQFKEKSPWTKSCGPVRRACYKRPLKRKCRNT